MISAAEMEVGLAQTREFIEADVETVVFLHRGQRVRNAAGGWTDVEDWDPRSDPQRVRLIHHPAGDKVQSVNTTDGDRERPEYTVIGMPDADFQEDDQFEWRGDRWKITYIHDKPDYIRKGDVILEHGGSR